MYQTIEEFTRDWEWESGVSLKVERALTDGSLDRRAEPEGRTLGRHAWHMVVMIGLTGSALGLQVTCPPRTAEPPSAAAAIADAYETAARSFGEQATAVLKDSRLAEPITYFGRTLPTSAVLQSLIRHQIHHRGQMTVLMRMAGLTVPGVYGPSREEAAARAKSGQ